MDSRLIQDTLSLLQQQLSPLTGINLKPEGTMLEEMTSLLHTCRLVRSRQLAVLGSYALLRMSLSKHRRMAGLGGAALTKHILDGDYLLGVFYRFVAQCNEQQLPLYLAPTLKKLQISIVEGGTFEEAISELLQAFRTYIEEQSRTGDDSDEAA